MESPAQGYSCLGCLSQAEEGWGKPESGLLGEAGTERPIGSSAARPLLCSQISLQQAELQSLREELQRQKELRAQEDPGEALHSALSDRDEAVNK